MSKRIDLNNPTGRKTPAHVVAIGDFDLFFSYRTLIGARGPGIGEKCRLRIANHWGPTTGKHFRELGMADWPVFDDSSADFEHFVYDAMCASIRADD